MKLQRRSDYCEDTVVDRRFLLKKDSVLRMPNSVIYSDRSVCGDTSFQPRRFWKHIEHEERAADASSTNSAGSYRPFGGWSTLCSGRHFAILEIMSLAAILFGGLIYLLQMIEDG